MAKISDYLTVGEAAEYLGVHLDSLRRWDRAGKFEPQRHPINSFRLYLKRDLDRFLAQIGGCEPTEGSRRSPKAKRPKHKR